MKPNHSSIQMGRLMQKGGLIMSEFNGPNRNAEPTVNRDVRKGTRALGIVVLSLVLLTGLLGGSGPVKAEGATISLSPTHLVLEVGGAGFVDVMVGEFTSAGGLGAYTLAIEYDESVVIVTSVDEGDAPFAGGTPAVGNEDGGGPISSTDNDAGEVRLLAFQASQATGPTGDIRVARIGLEAVGGSGASTELTLVAPGLVDAQTGEFVSVTATNGSVSIGGGRGEVSGQTTLQYRATTDGRAMVEISCPSLTRDTVPADDGTWRITGVPEETCTLTATGPGYLKAEGTLTVGGSGVMVPANELLGGDATGDGFVALDDITGMIAQFAKSTENCEIDGKVVDVDCDGVVALNDITRAISNFAQTTQPFPTE